MHFAHVSVSTMAVERSFATARRHLRGCGNISEDTINAKLAPLLDSKCSITAEHLSRAMSNLYQNQQRCIGQFRDTGNATRCILCCSCVNYSVLHETYVECTLNMCVCSFTCEQNPQGGSRAGTRRTGANERAGA